MSIELIFALAAFAFVSSITPGPNNLMLMASGANFGLVKTIPHMLGIGIGFAFMLTMVGLGIIGLFEAFPITLIVLKVVSAAYLLYLAWKIATAAPPQHDDTASDSARKPLTFLQAALFQWVNPKAWAMALTAISAYTSAASPIISVLIVAVVFGLVNLPTITVWTLLGTQLRRLLSAPIKLRIFNWICAGLLVATLWPVLKSAA